MPGRASSRIEVDTEVIAGGVGEVLFYTEVFLGGLDGVVAERELDLFEGDFALVSQPRKCSPAMPNSA